HLDSPVSGRAVRLQASFPALSPGLSRILPLCPISGWESFCGFLAWKESLNSTFSVSVEISSLPSCASPLHPGQRRRKRRAGRGSKLESGSAFFLVFHT